MKVGAVNFLNAYPLYYAFDYGIKSGQFRDQDNEPVTLIKNIPSYLADSLLAKKLDTAIISSIEYFRNKDRFKFCPSLCIAARGKVESIRLYRQDNELSFPDWLSKQNEVTVYFDVATRSSLAMLRIILRHYAPSMPVKQIEIRPPFQESIQNLKDHELLLLIGDAALQLKDLPSTDMGELYFKTFNRAFIYAIWVYHKDGKDPEKLLMNAYEWGQRHKEELYENAVENFGFSAGFTKEYLSEIIRYEMTPELTDDMNFFFEKFSLL